MGIVQELQEQGICPTCYKFEHGGVYSDFTKRLIFEDEWLYCFLEERPRAKGHTIILVKAHYDDMAALPDELCAHVFTIAKKLMNVLKTELKAERVYLCSMCDGKANHFHAQLLPRYAGEKIGSTNFVKERWTYDGNPVPVERLEQLIKAMKEGTNNE
ncbi:HIT family protein [Lactococcus protaetiae]|uniref:HIT family protein n=1 Tax=Lactococcus protaetiae TaxID=2592653 RepID=A0A514Z921_9LACT|nr:HIT family protein [Lactococcus protaetiae]QDK71027.1 HIT family protein [Lactococcus protaetiae]